MNIVGVKDLLSKIDFIGISAYAPWPQQLSPSAMEVPIQTVAYEMKPFGIDLNAYLMKQNKQLIYSEQGLGGCTEGGRVAPDLAFVKKHPFWGVWPAGGYQPGQDPWKVSSSAALTSWMCLLCYCKGAGAPVDAGRQESKKASVTPRSAAGLCC